MTFAEVHSEVRRIVGPDAYVHLAYEAIESRGELTVNWRLIVSTADRPTHASVHQQPESMLAAVALALGSGAMRREVFDRSINSVGTMPESDS